VSGLPCQLPVWAEFVVKVLPAFFGEEDSGTLEFDTAASAGDVVAKPVRPFDIEIDVVCRPNDERGSFQGFEAVFDGERVLIIESCQKAFQIVETLFAAEERAQVFFNAVVGQLLGMFVGGA